MYITVEGPIGSGKTSLTKLLADEFNYHDIYEIVDENPFLPKFYEDQERWAFQTEMFFLVNRYDQLRSLQEAFVATNGNIVADYNIYKNIIFANKTLNEKEFGKVEEIYKIMVDDLRKADIVVVLKANLDTLRERIQRRGRIYEEHIEDEYLEYLIEAYDEFIEKTTEEYPDKLLVIDADNYDFVNNIEQKEEILQMLRVKGVDRSAEY